MPDRDLHEQRLKKLLAQDPEINHAQLEEFRMQLDQSLESWEEKAKKTRRRILIALAVYLPALIACQFLAAQWHDAAPNDAVAMVRGLVYWPFVISGLAAALAGIWLGALYIFKYVPRLQRARFDVQTSMLLELQEQVRQLREHADQRDK